MELHHFKPFQFIIFLNFLQPWWKIFNYNVVLDHFKPFQFIKFQNFLQPWWKIFNYNMELDHFKPFPFIKFQNFLQPWWKIFNYNVELDHFKPFPFIKFQNFLQPWLPRIFGNKSPGVECKSVGVRVKSVGVEFEILLTCLGCGSSMESMFSLRRRSNLSIFPCAKHNVKCSCEMIIVRQLALTFWLFCASAPRSLCVCAGDLREIQHGFHTGISVRSRKLWKCPYKLL